MNRLEITGYVGGDHASIVDRMEAEDAAVLTRTATNIAKRVGGVDTAASVRRHESVLQLVTPGFEDLDGVEIEVAPVGAPEARLTQVKVRTKGAFDSASDQFLSAGLFTAQATATLQRAS